MLRKLLSITTALALVFTAPVRAAPDAFPRDRIWQGIIGCPEGFRPLRMASIDLPHPIILVQWGPSHAPDDFSGEGLASFSERGGPDGEHFTIDRTLVKAPNGPTALIARMDADGDLSGDVQGIRGCEHFEIVGDHSEHTRQELAYAHANPERYINRMAANVISPEHAPSTAWQLAEVAFAATAILGLLAAGSGAFGSPKGGGGGGGGYQAEEEGQYHEAPDVGGNVHGNDPADVHGNPW